MAADTNEQKYRRLIDEGFNKGNLAAVDEIVSADLKEHENMPPGITPGLEGLKILITGMRAGFPDQKSTIEDIAVDGDKIWSRIVIRATNTGPFMGMPPTGKRVTDIGGIDIVEVKGSKLGDHWGYVDSTSMMTQLGLLPPMG